MLAEISGQASLQGQVFLGEASEISNGERMNSADRRYWQAGRPRFGKRMMKVFPGDKVKISRGYSENPYVESYVHTRQPWLIKQMMKVLGKMEQSPQTPISLHTLPFQDNKVMTSYRDT